MYIVHVVYCHTLWSLTTIFQFVDLCNKNSTNLNWNLHEVQSFEQQFPASVGHSRLERKENERPPLSSETLFCITADHFVTETYWFSKPVLFNVECARPV